MPPKLHQDWFLFRLWHRLAPLALLAALPCLAHAASSPATWTTGHKKVLIIPIAFTDQVGPSDTPSATGYRSGWGNITNGTTPAALNDFFQRTSYGKLSLDFTVLPEINLGVSYTAYNAPYGTTGLTKFAAWDEPGSLADDARAKARLAGQLAGQAARYDSDNYDFDIFIGGFIPGQGVIASASGYGKGIFGTTTLALAHELCHNFGLQHANGISRSTFHSPLKSGTFFTDAYGDVFDLMGWKNTGPIPLTPDRDPNPFWKNLLGWLPDGHIATPSSPGVYRIHAFDQPTLAPGQHYALRLVRDPLRTYWFSYRQSITNAESIWSQNGLEVRIGGESIPATAGHTTLLDMTPGSRGLANAPGLTNSPYATLYDAPLAIGRTYSDADAGLHVTPIRKAGTTPESLDVMVNLGQFPGNHAPIASITPATLTLAAGVPQTFTATASDPDGDALSYYWEFDDPDALGGNAAGNSNPDARLSTQGSHTWTRNGQHRIRCTVSDMKGRTTIATATVTITGGTPALLTITGVVKDENGTPLAGAVVNNYKGANPNLVRYGSTTFVGSSETGADGRYTVLVPASVTGTNLLNVLYQGSSFTCSSPNAAIKVASANVTDVDFTRVRTNRTLSGGIYVAGRGYDPATDGPLQVTVAGQTVAAAAGNWSAIVPDGAPLQIAATAANPAYTVIPFAPNPYFVANDFNLLHLFVQIPGRMPQVGFTTNSMTSDDTVGTVNIPVNLFLPPGSNSWPANQAVYYWIDPTSTAEYGVDYRMTGGGLTFYGGQVPTPQNISLRILPTREPKSKTVVVRLSPASSIANLAPNTTFTYTITNPPAPPLNHGSLQFAQAAHSVSESAGNITLLVQRVAGTDGSVSVSYATANGSAIAPADFTATNGTLSWLAGDSASKAITIALANDTNVENNETFTVTLSNPLGGATNGTPATATVTINDDDLPPTNSGSIQFAQADYSVSESAGTVTLAATRSGGSDGMVSGYYRTTNGTALAGLDFTATTNLISWANGDTAPKNILLTILNDSLVEPTESFTVTFVATTGGATIGSPATATVTITDDDLPPTNAGSIQFAQADYSVSESAGTVTLVATRSGGSDGMVSGYYRTTNGSALATLDYTATTNLISWANGDSTPKNILLTILNDSLVESAESFTVTFIASSGGATIGSPATATVTITDDDVVTPENHAPILPPNAVFTIASLTELVVTNTATDTDLPTQTLTYELLSRPPGATIDNRGVIRWTPATASTNFFQTRATDNGVPARSATNNFYVIVTEPLPPAENHAPILAPNAVFTITSLNELVVTNTATDNDLPAQTLTYELLSRPPGATIDNRGIIRWTPATASTNFFQTRVTDNGVPSRSATNNFYVIVTEPLPPSENHAPTLPRPTVVTAIRLMEMVFTNTATDIDLPPQSLTYELLAKPTGATIDANGIVRWTPSALQSPSTNRFRVKATDNGLPARSATNVFYVIVTDGNNAPHLFGPSSLILSNNSPFTETFHATDSDSPANHLTFQLVSGPDWISFTPIDARHARLAGTPPTVTSNSVFTAVLQVSDDGSPPLTNRLAIRLYIRPTAPPCLVERQLPAGYSPNTSVLITLQATPGEGTTTYTIADAPPANWTIGTISAGGYFDTPSGTVRFGPFPDANPRTLSYAVTPPLTETGPKTFAGIVARNGNYSGICGPDSLPPLHNHPADSGPTDLRLTATEVTAYAAAWKSGTPWPTAPNPIHPAFVTRADYLQRNGETYTINSTAIPPLTWIPTPRAGVPPRTPTNTGTPTGKGCWRFLPHKLGVGATATTTLVVNPAPTDTSYAVEESPPPGWTVTDISHDGAYDPATGSIRWGLFTDAQPRTLTYALTPTGATAPFTGIAAFDGTTFPIAGTRQPEVLPAISETEFAPATRLSTGEIVLPLATRPGTVTVIEISPDLRQWTPIWTNAPGAQLFRELPVNIPAGRFYRLIEQ